MVSQREARNDSNDGGLPDVVGGDLFGMRIEEQT